MAKSRINVRFIAIFLGILALVLAPIVLLYTAWAYKVMFGRVTAQEVRMNPDFY